jgi:glycosyltransferase involved in cell wall biosynthesis
MTSANDKPRVGVDARCLNVEHLRGMGKYLFEIISRIDREEHLQWRLFSDRPDWPMHVPAAGGVRCDVFEQRGYRFRSWEQWGLPRRARRERVDVLHCAGTTLPWWQPVPTVVTLHDTIPWRGAGADHRPCWYWDQVIPRALARAAAVITISDTSARDILELWPHLEDRLHVIPHGIGDEYLKAGAEISETTLEHLGVRRPYLLYVGGGIARKRLSWAFNVFAQLAECGVQLVACGVGHDEVATIRAGLTPSLRSRTCFPTFIPETAMPSLYRGAIAVLYPTLYEGFGLPVVEAQSVGTPVLFSAVGSLAELQGPGAEVLPTDDPTAWVDTCRRLIAERGASLQPNEAARQWARQFSWDVSAAKHYEVYCSAARYRATS